MVSLGVALDAGFKWDSKKSVQFIASDGEKSSTLGSFIAAIHAKENYLVDIEIHVSDELPLSALLGLNFLKSCSISFKNRWLEYIGGNGSHRIHMLRDEEKLMWRPENFLPSIHNNVQAAIQAPFQNCLQEAKRRLDAMFKTNVHPVDKEEFSMKMFKDSSFGNFDQGIRLKLEALLERYQKVFQIDDEDTLYKGPNARELDLQLTSKTYSRPKKLLEVPELAKEQFQAQINEWLKKNVIEEQTKIVPYINSFVLVKKPNGKVRFCLDARHLNSTVEFETVQLEPVDELAAKISRFKILTHVDISNFYLSFKVSPRTADFLTFQGPNGNYYKFVRSIFGLRGSAAHSINQTREALAELKIFNVRLFIYCDDIILANNNYEEMLEDLQTLFDFMLKANFKMKASKAKFGLEKISLFGFQVSHRKVEIDPERKNALLQIPPPTSRRALLSHLGSLGYYRKNFPADLPLAKFQSLFRHLISGNDFDWSDEDSKNWTLMHSALADSISRTSLENTDKVVFLKCDASKDYCGWIITVIRNGIEVIISTGSKVFPPSYAKFNASRLELIGALLALKANFQLLYMRQTVVVTDNPSVLHIFNNLDSVAIVEPSLIGRLFQAVSLLQFSAKKSQNSDAQWPIVDALSRNTRKFIISARNIAELLQDHDVVMKTSSVLQEARVFGSEVSLMQDLGVEDLKFMENVLENCPIKAVQCLNHAVATAQADPIFEKFGVVAKRYQEDLVLAAHRLGHIGIVKLTSLLNYLNLKWNNRSQTINTVLRRCDICTTVKSKTQGALAQNAMYPVTTPMAHIALDLNIIGQGDNSISLLVIIDMATDFIWARKVPNPVNARNVLRILFDFMVTWTPTLQTITLDNGRQFRSELFQAAMESLNVKLSFVARYSSRGNGRCELANKRINNILRLKKIDPEEPNFNYKLQAAVSSLNLEVNGKTKLSPFNLLFGIDPFTNEQRPPDVADDCPSFRQKARLFRELKQMYSGYPQLFPELAYAKDDIVRILVVQRKGQNKITRLRFSPILYQIMDVNHQTLTYKLCPVDDPTNHSKHVICHHRHLKMIKPGSNQRVETKESLDEDSNGAGQLNANGVHLPTFGSIESADGPRPTSPRDVVTSKTDSKDVVVQDERNPHVADSARKSASDQTVSDPCKAFGKEGDIISPKINQRVEYLGDGATNQNEVEVLPENVFGQISLIKSPSTPDAGWVVRCDLLMDILPHLKSFKPQGKIHGGPMADVLVSIGEEEFFKLKKKALVNKNFIRFWMDYKDYSEISLKRRACENVALKFKLYLKCTGIRSNYKNREIESHVKNLSHGQWIKLKPVYQRKNFKPVEDMNSKDQDGCHESSMEASRKQSKGMRQKRQQRKRCQYCKLFTCNGKC